MTGYQEPGGWGLCVSQGVRGSAPLGWAESKVLLMGLLRAACLCLGTKSPSGAHGVRWCFPGAPTGSLC